MLIIPFVLYAIKNKKRRKHTKILIGLLSVIFFIGCIAETMATLPDTVDFHTMVISNERGSPTIDYRIEGKLTLTSGSMDFEPYYIALQALSVTPLNYALSGAVYSIPTPYPYNFQGSESTIAIAQYRLGTVQCRFALEFHSYYPNKYPASTSPTLAGDLSLYTSTSGNTTLSFSADTISTAEFSLKPVISLDSEHFNHENTRIEWTTDSTNWYEATYDSITLNSWRYKARIYHIESNDLVYSDNDYVNYTTHRDVKIDSVKLINNANEPVWFHISNRTTSYNNLTYQNSAELVSMFTGTKNSSDYSCLDYSDLNSLLLEPIGTGQSVYDSHTEQWYADSDTMFNGTRSGDFNDLESIDSNYFTLNSNVDSEIVDYHWSYESWFANSYYLLNGATSSSISTTYIDDSSFFEVDSAITSQTESSYNDHTESFNPYSISYTNGSASSGSISSLTTDDTTYLEIDANKESYGTGDYVSYNYTGTADSASITNGTASGSLSNVNANDDSTYNVSSDTGGGGVETVYYESDWLQPDEDISNTGWTRNTGSSDYYTYLDDWYDDDTTYLDENAVPNGFYFYFNNISSLIPNGALVTNITINHRSRRVGGGIFTPVSSGWYHGNGTQIFWQLGGVSTAWATFTNTLQHSLGGINGGRPLTRGELDSGVYGYLLGTSSYHMQCSALRYKVGFEYEESSSSYETDGYIEFDYSTLGSSGNITARSDITDIGLNYRFHSNVSQQISIYAYNWTSTTWDILTSTNPTSETAYSNYSLGTEFFKNDVNDLLFRIRFANGTEPSASFETYFDLISLEVEYENQLHPYYDTYYGLDFIIEWDIGNLIDIGNMTDKNDLVSTLMDVTKSSWDWGVGEDFITVSYWNYDTGAWHITQDTIAMSTYSSFDSTLGDTDLLDDVDLWSADLICKMRWQITDTSETTFGYALEEDILTNSTCKIYLDFAELDFEYTNQNDPNYDRIHSIDGYFEWDLSDLYNNGNITDRDEIVSIYFNWIWTSNLSESFSWDFYNWDGSSWTSVLDTAPTADVFQEENYILTNINGLDSSSYKVRLCFNISYSQLDEKFSDGIDLSIDYSRLKVTYHNQRLPTYDWYNYISGYSEIDLTELFTLGNLTDTSQITDTLLSYNWKTNVSESCEFHAWDFTHSDWDSIDSDTQTAFATDTSDIYDTVADYIDSVTKTARFSYNISYYYANQTDNQDIQLDFDLIQLEIDYWNQREEYNNWNLSYQIEWDYDEISPFFSWDWINHTNMIYEYFFNTTVDYVDIEFKYNDTAFTNYHNGVYTTSTEISNLTQPIDYFNNTLKFIMDVNVSMYSHWYEPFEMYLEYTNMSIFFGNQTDIIYIYEGIRDILVVPYDYALHNIDADNYPSGSGTLLDPYIYQAYNVTDLYGNFLVNDTLIPDFTDYLELNYTSPFIKQCFISLADQQGTYLPFANYKVKVNGSFIYDPIFERELGDTVNITVYDRFDQQVTTINHTVDRENNWIGLTITLHTIKIFNMQEQFAYFNITKYPVTPQYWSEWLAPTEISIFKFYQGSYVINLTEYEFGSSSLFHYNLTADDILLVTSNNTLNSIANLSNSIMTLSTYLTQLYQNAMFSNLLNWTDIARDYTFIQNYIDTWTFLNNYKNDTIVIEFYFEGTYEKIYLQPQEQISHILPKENVNYRAINEVTGEVIQNWNSLENATAKIEFGFYEADISLSDIDVEYNEWFALVLTIVTFFLAVIILFAFAKRKIEQQKAKDYRERRTKSDYQKTKVRDKTNVFF